MVSNNEKLTHALCGSLALPASSFADRADDVARVLKCALHRALSLRIEGLPAIYRETDSTRVLALLLVLHRLLGLPGKNNLVDVNLVHDVIVWSGCLKIASVKQQDDVDNITFLIAEIINDLLRKRPSLAVAIIKTVLPSYAVVINDLVRQTMPVQRQQAVVVLENVAALLTIPLIGQAAASNPGDSSLWIAVYSLYAYAKPCYPNGCLLGDVQLPPSLAEASLDAQESFLRVFALLVPILTFESLVTLLEAEAESEVCTPRSPNCCCSGGSSLLADAEQQYVISTDINPRIAEPQRGRIIKSLKSLTSGVDASASGHLDQISFTKAKWKQEAAWTGDLDDASRMRSEVLAIMPEADADLVDRMIEQASTAVNSEARVHAVIAALLDGRSSIEEPADAGDPFMAADGVQLPASTAEPRPSAFAAARANIFSERMDEQHMRTSKTRFDRDPLLPQELKDAIKAAYARQELEALEDEDAAANEARQNESDTDTLSDVEDISRQRRLRGARSDSSGHNSDEIDDEVCHADKPGTVHRSPYTPTTASGYTASTENALLQAYIANVQLFAQASRKLTARAELRKRLGLADEQIEGWARMLERDPRKAKRLDMATEFRGNVQRPSVEVGTSSADTANKSQETGRSAGEEQSRGRVRKGGHGHQGERRRRGHDRKLQRMTGAAAS